MRFPFIDNIWRIRGEWQVPEPLDAEEAFDRLDPLFRTTGTVASREGNTLVYRKHNPAAQDKLATFTSGTLTFVGGASGARLRYDLSSNALLLCFLAPLLFLGFALLAQAINDYEMAEKPKEEQTETKPVPKLHPVDEMLGAPKPEDPNKKDEEEEEGRHSPEPGYALAGLFFLVYLVGRFLEPWLARRTFINALSRKDDAAPELPQGIRADA